MFVKYGHNYGVSSYVMTVISSTIGHKLIVTISLATDRFLNGVMWTIVIIVNYTSVVVRISANNNIAVHISAAARLLLIMLCIAQREHGVVLLLLLVMIRCLPDTVEHSFWPVILLAQPAELTKLSNKIKPLSGRLGRRGEVYGGKDLWKR